MEDERKGGGKKCARARAHTQTHIHTHTHTHARMHAHAHAHTKKERKRKKHDLSICLSASVYACVPTHLQTYRHAHTLTQSESEDNPTQLAFLLALALSLSRRFGRRTRIFHSSYLRPNGLMGIIRDLPSPFHSHPSRVIIARVNSPLTAEIMCGSVFVCGCERQGIKVHVYVISLERPA